MAQSFSAQHKHQYEALWGIIYGLRLMGAPIAVPDSFDEPVYDLARRALAEMVGDTFKVTTVHSEGKVTYEVNPKLKIEKIKRPANAWILFRQHHHPNVKITHPNITNNGICKL